MKEEKDGTKGLIASPSSIVARSIAADDEWNANLLKLKKMTSRMEILYKEVLHENPPSSSEPLPLASSSSSEPPPPASASSFSSSEIGLPSSATVEALAKLDLLVMPVGKVLPVFKLDKAQKSLEELQSKVKADKVCLQEIEALEKELAVLEKEEQLRLLMLDIDGLMVKTEMTKKINGEALANVQSIVGADVEDLDKLKNLSNENIESNQKRADQAEKESPCQDQESLSVSKESQPISTEKAADEAPMIAKTRPKATRSVKAASSSSSLSQDTESLSVAHTQTQPTLTEKVVDEAPVIAKTSARATRAVKAASSSISSSSITPKNKRKSVADLEASFNQQWNGALKETEELKAEDTKHLPYVVLPADAGPIKGKSVIPGIFSSLGSSVKPNSYENYANYNRFDGNNSENMPPHNVQPQQLSKLPAKALDAEAVPPAAPKLLKKASTLSASLTSVDGTSAPTPGLPLTAQNRRITLQPVVSHQQKSSMIKRRSSISSMQPDPMACMFSTPDLRQVPIGQIQELGPISWMRP